MSVKVASYEVKIGGLAGGEKGAVAAIDGEGAGFQVVVCCVGIFGTPGINKDVGRVSAMVTFPPGFR